MCSEDELSDDEDSDNTGQTGLFHRPTKSDSGTFSDVQNAHTASELTVTTSSLDVDGDIEDGADFQKCGSSNVTTAPCHSLSQLDEGILNKSESPGSESPFVPIRSPSDYTVMVAGSTGPESSTLTIVSENCTNQDDGSLEAKLSPKLEHKAVRRVKSMMSIEAPSTAQQQKAKADETCLDLAQNQPLPLGTESGRNPRTGTGLITPQDCKKGDTSELGGVCTIDTVTLKRSENESFGLDLEIVSSPLKVVIAGIKPGGAAERECSAKLHLGEEIVKIGETLVCSSSYQEICKLTHNLPMTLSLEVKRPVSAVDQLSSLINLSSRSTDRAARVIAAGSVQGVSDEGQAIPQTTGHFKHTRQTDRDFKIPVTNIDDILTEGSPCSDGNTHSKSPFKPSTEPVSCSSSQLVVGLSENADIRVPKQSGPRTAPT
ncbi:hypothetical protein Q5P01_014287 [Channa striata]|uniref:PDZ domain-containing protein n=1 Tax=Channa striata TaxID=64152 RepID=A0AA88MGX5_CHASR|nr:hypothetical protein Q5P01_014287 [Channa striata]